MLVILSHPESGWSMVKFSAMLENTLNEIFDDVQFIRPSSFLSQRLDNESTRKVAKFLEKKIFFPIKVFLTIRRIKPSFILLSDHSDAYQTVLCGRTKRIVICHDLFAIQASLGEIPGVSIPGREKIENYLNYLILKRMDLVIAVSGFTKKNVERLLPGVPVHVLHLTASNVELPKKSSERNFSELGNFCLLPMNAHWRKNRFFGIQSWCELRKAAGITLDLKLVIVGNELDLDEVAFVSESGLNVSVSVYTDVTEEFLRYLYEKCQFVLFTSKFEGFGLPIIEANRMRKVAIHSDLEVLNEVAGFYNLRLNEVLAKNDWTEIFNAATSQARRTKVLNYFDSDFSQQNFAANLLLLLAEFKKTVYRD